MDSDEEYRQDIQEEEQALSRPSPSIGTGIREKTQTEKGKLFYEQKLSERLVHNRRIWQHIESLTSRIEDCANDYNALIDLEKTFKSSVEKLNAITSDLLNFCVRAGTSESIDDAKSVSLRSDGYKLLIDDAQKRIDDHKRVLCPDKSNASKRSSISGTSSARSSVVSVVMQSKAKAEAAKARLKYAELEANLIKKQAALDQKQAFEQAKVKLEKANISADLEVLACEREVAAAEAEVGVLESDKNSHSSRRSQNNDDLPAESNTLVNRTNQYVEEALSRTQSGDFEQHELKCTGASSAEHSLNPNAQTFLPSHSPNVQTVVPKQPDIVDFTQYLLKKDLLLTRLSHFDDRPESYRSWKVSFQTVMRELKVTPQEELDLLLKWTGSESGKHVLSIKAANVSDPVIGLKRSWSRLDERYGCPEMLETSLKRRIENFPKLTVKDTKKLYELSDLVSEIESIKDDDRMKCLFAHYDSSTGVTPIVNKLPHPLQEKWTTCAVKYCNNHNVSYPPFSHFVKFVGDQSKIRNNPSFAYEVSAVRKSSDHQRPDSFVNAKATETKDVPKLPVAPAQNIPKKVCPLHHTEHSLNKCRAFRLKPLTERLKFLKEKNICFRCCDSSSHVKRNCKETIQCTLCSSSEHSSALHPMEDTKPGASHGGEASFSSRRNDKGLPSDTSAGHHGGGASSTTIRKDGESCNVSNACTQLCGQEFTAKSCAKVVLAEVYSQQDPSKIVRLYALLDDQSNRTLANSELFDMLHLNGEVTEYILSSCSGKSKAYGRRASDLIIESLDHTFKLQLPTVTECQYIPDNRNEIPTHRVAQCYPHLQDIVEFVPPLDENAQIMILIGRDAIALHHVLDHRVGPANAPYAQRLPLGWTIIGECCLGNTHSPHELDVRKTNILNNGRGTLFEPCTNQFQLKETETASSGSLNHEFESLGSDVFRKTKDDDKPGLSVNDRLFLRILEKDFQKDDSGNWICPLPFKEPKPVLQNNYSQVLKRARILDKSLQKDPVKKQQFLEFMSKMLKNGHAEEAPALQEGEEGWFLPIFAVYHPKKQNQVRIVFDSAAKFNGVSLNDLLLSGPDLTNSLLGILLRFRREPVAVVGDIEQMFYSFLVSKEHRNYLRFLWHKDNEFDKPLVEFRMCVHIFGNTASPSIAAYGLRKTASQNTLSSDVIEFVNNDFYVDDGLTSLPSVEQAIDLIQKTQQVLQTEGNLRFHKIASNCEEVMNAFPTKDLAKDLKTLDLGTDQLPVQRSLGVSWCLQSDTFLFEIMQSQQPFTRRGVLSTVNSIFDPLGFIAPIVFQGKLLLRKLVQGTTDWDEPLPQDQHAQWETWTKSLQDLQGLSIPRTFLSTSFSDADNKHVHVFSDASENAIAAVGYLSSVVNTGKPELGFILGKAKVAPSRGLTIPRLELCAAVLAVEIAESIAKHLHLPISDFTFHTDSKVVLGYICNQSRRFYTYVSNRVNRIRSSTESDQWRYVMSKNNPADQATRCIPASEMPGSTWLNGPTFLTQYCSNDHESVDFEIQDPENDKEVRPLMKSLKTDVVESSCLGHQRFNRFSSWSSLVESIARLKHIAKSYGEHGECHRWHVCDKARSVDAFESAQKHIIREVQKEVYPDEISRLVSGKPLPKSSNIYRLDPYIDDEGILRVGGRLKNSVLTVQEKHPILIPGRNHIALLIVRYMHEKAQHAGRHITEGVIRSSGYWITRAKSIVSSVISKCVKCQKLRGTLSCQKMSDLPQDRLVPGPPFSNVGVDCFGPWLVVSRKTRGGLANSKRWGVLFTCLTTRAVHIEVVEELTSSSFINALRRFIAIRGPVNVFRSDRGTNFVGSVDLLGIDVVNVEDGRIKDFLYQNGCTWIFNPPHASHMGGVWERMIGVTRRILDSLLLDVPGSGLSHEVLVTFLAEVSAIINSRPLVPISDDPDVPFPLSPSTLLTQKPDTITGIPFALNHKDVFGAQWKRVQILAERFWKRWRTEYLQSLQPRRKWNESQRNLKEGDIVLMRDNSVCRNQWPLGIVEEVFQDDGYVRKVKLRVVKDGVSYFTRPITELVLLIPEGSGY